MILLPLEWYSCLLHFNELLFTHLFKYLGSEMTGLASYSGEIIKQLASYEKCPVVNFRTIESEEIDVTKTYLSKHQQYMLDIVRTVQTLSLIHI